IFVWEDLISSEPLCVKEKRILQLLFMTKIFLNLIKFLYKKDSSTYTSIVRLPIIKLKMVSSSTTRKGCMLLNCKIFLSKLTVHLSKCKQNLLVGKLFPALLK